MAVLRRWPTLGQHESYHHSPLPSSLPCVSFIGLTLSYNLHSKLVNSKYNAFMSSVSHSRELLNLNWGHRNPWICSWLGRIVGSLGTLVWLVWSEGTCGACIDSRINVKLNWIVRHSVGAGELLWKMIGIWCQTHTSSVESGVRRQRTESFFPSAALGPGFLEGYVSPWILHWEAHLRHLLGTFLLSGRAAIDNYKCVITG